MKRRSPHAIALAGMLALAVAMGIGRFAFTPLLPMMIRDAGLTVEQGGWLAAANYAGYLAGALAAAAFDLREGRLATWGLAAIAASTFAMGCTHSEALWIALRTIAGIGSAWVLVQVSASTLERLAAHGRPGWGALVFCGVGLGIAAAGVICLAAIAQAVSSSHAWLILGTLAGAVSLAILPLLDGRAPTGNSARSRPARGLFDREARRLMLCYGIFGFGYIVPATFLPVMAHRAVAGAGSFGWSWPIFGAAACVSTLAVAPLARRLGHRALWLWAQVAMALGVALPAIASGIVPVALAALLVGGTFMIATMAGVQEARVIGGDGAARLIAAMTAAFALGQMLGPAAASIAVRTTGSLSTALLLAAALLVVSSWALAATPAPSRTSN